MFSKYKSILCSYNCIAPPCHIWWKNELCEGSTIAPCDAHHNDILFAQARVIWASKTYVDRRVPPNSAKAPKSVIAQHFSKRKSFQLYICNVCSTLWSKTMRKEQKLHYKKCNMNVLYVYKKLYISEKDVVCISSAY